VETDRNRSSWNIWNPISLIQTVLLVSLVATVSYLALKLEGALTLHPQTVWPLWPGWALLVPVLLVVPRRLWLILIGVAFAAFVFYDLQAGVPLRSIAWFVPADTIQVLIATLCLKHFFGGVPQLDSVRSLTRYLFFAVILAPFVAAFISAPGIGTDYWHGWRICFFSDVLSFLTLTTAILNWISNGHAWVRKSRMYQLEAAVLIIGLALVSYLSFAAPDSGSSPALLYSLVPFLLWSALRFGSTGVSSAILVVVFLSIWGAVHGRGPFVERAPLQNVFPIQLFLIFSATPFLVLAALVEERKTDEEALRKGEERLRLAIQAGKMYAFEWNTSTDSIVRSSGNGQVLGVEGQLPTTGQETFAKVHPDDRERLFSAFAVLNPEKPSLQISHRMVGPDGAVVWVDRAIRAYFDERGRMLRIIGMVADVTERKKAEEALHQREKELLEAQRVAQVGNWQWDPTTGVVVWSKELYRIAGRDPNLSPPPFGEQSRLYMPESYERLKLAVTETLQTGKPYTLDLQIVRPDGSTRWITDHGEALRDGAGRIAWLRGTAQDITERKRADDALRESEEKFRSVFRDAGVGMVIVSTAGRFLAANDAFCKCLGYTEEELLQMTVQSITVPKDWPDFSRRFNETVERGTSFQKVEKHCLHKNGRIVTTETSASLIRGPCGEPRYFVAVVLDITHRKLAEEALSSVSRRLIEAHEEERTWIARELHDDFNQRITLLAVNLEKVKQDLPASLSESHHCFDETLKSVRDLASDIHALSHRLHSSKLEYLGLAAAADGLCRETSDRQDVEIDFHAENIPRSLPKEISLCLFRVLQEALQNAVRHSGVRQFEVSLKGASDEIQLCVRDSGLGFDSEKAITCRGLGLVSMKERLKLVGGKLSIDAKLQHGTSIDARVPLRTRTRSARAGRMG
jgi:PAS domain S-box-containing protein